MPVSSPPFPTLSMSCTASGVGSYVTADPGGDPGLNTGVWGTGIAFYLEAHGTNFEIVNHRSNNINQGWLWFFDNGTYELKFRIGNGSGLGDLAWPVKSPDDLLGAIVVAELVINNLTSTETLWVNRVSRATMSFGFVPFAGPERLWAYTAAHDYAPVGKGLISKWSWSSATLPTALQMESHFDDIYNAGGCPATLQGVTMRSRYNLRNDYSREVVGASYPASPTAIQDRVGTQHFTRAGGALGPHKYFSRAEPAGKNLGWPFFYTSQSQYVLNNEWLPSTKYFARFTAVNRGLVGGKVSTFYEETGSYALRQSNAAYQCGDRTMEPILNNQYACTFDGNQIYTSDRPSDYWQFLVDGSGCTVACVFLQTLATGGTSMVVTTGSANPYLAMSAYEGVSGGSTGKVGVQLRNSAGGSVYGISTENSSPNYRGMYSVISYKRDTTSGVTDGHFMTRMNATPIAFESSAVPSASNVPLVLGGHSSTGTPGSFPFSGRWSELIIWKRKLTINEMLVLRSYFQKKYAII